jgi:transcriptional regulator with XRE-family HTH domain
MTRGYGVTAPSRRSQPNPRDPSQDLVRSMSIAFGRLIKRHRESQGWTRAELADRVGGLSEFEIARIEWGDGGPPTHTVLDALATALGVRPQLLLATSGWYAAQMEYAKVLSAQLQAPLAPELAAGMLAVIRTELTGLQDVEVELAAWLDDVYERIDQLQADAGRQGAPHGMPRERDQS